MTDWSDEVKARLWRAVNVGPLHQTWAEDIAVALRENERLREALKEILDHVEMQNCDVIGAIQNARAALRGGGE